MTVPIAWGFLSHHSGQVCEEAECGALCQKLGKVQKNDIHLLPFSHVGGNFLVCCQQLSLAWASLTESILVVTQDVMLVKMLHNIAVNYVIQQFTGYGRQGNGSIVGCLMSIAFLKQWDYRCLPPVLWDFAEVQGSRNASSTDRRLLVFKNIINK